MPEPLVIFTPQEIREALLQMTDEQAFELDAYASKDHTELWFDLGDSEYLKRATAWLIAHGFSGRAVLILPEGKAS